MASKRRPVSGEPMFQVDNPDPYARPKKRSPIVPTDIWEIRIVQFFRTWWMILRFIGRHPVLTGFAALLGYTAWRFGWPYAVVLVGVVAAAILVLRLVRPSWFRRLISDRIRHDRRQFYYRRRWEPTMTLAGLAPEYRSRILLPELRKVKVCDSVDLVTVKMVTGQTPKNFADQADTLAHSFDVDLCRVRKDKPGWIVLEFVRADTLADPFGIDAMQYPDDVELTALPVGLCEDGTLWRLRLLGAHLLAAGATGAGKGSVLWSIVRALLPAIRDGWVKVWALDPKRMELALGRGLFDQYADQSGDMVELLESAVAEMQKRATKFGGFTRTFTPSREFPFLVIMADELAFLTAYQPDRDLRKRAEAAIATLTSQGRSVGVCVVGALQDPRKDVISLRNLFPSRIALRLDESDQVDMVLGDGARDRGALADEISPVPEVGAGVAYVRLETSPDPVRVRAAFVSDDDIRAMVTVVAGGSA